MHYSVIMSQEGKLRHVCTRTHCHQDFGSVLEGSEDRRTIIAVRVGVLRWHGDKRLILLIAVARHRCTRGHIPDGITPHSSNTPSPTHNAHTHGARTRTHTNTTKDEQRARIEGCSRSCEEDRGERGRQSTVSKPYSCQTPFVFPAVLLGSACPLSGDTTDVA